jgi:rhodanese-related sulfurtransferase
MQQISTHQLADWLAAGKGANVEQRQMPTLLDVRQPWEFERGHIAGSALMTMHTVPLRLSELDKKADLVVICEHGARSMQVAMFLENNGFSSIYNLAGGVSAWIRDVDPALRKF